MKVVIQEASATPDNDKTVFLVSYEVHVISTPHPGYTFSFGPRAFDAFRRLLGIWYTGGVKGAGPNGRVQRHRAPGETKTRCHFVVVVAASFACGCALCIVWGMQLSRPHRSAHLLILKINACLAHRSAQPTGAFGWP